MLFGALTPLQRLSLLPWLPTPEREPLVPAEAEALRRAREAAGDADATPVPLQTPFAGLRIPAVGDLPACANPPVTYWQTDPALPPMPAAPNVADSLLRWQTAVNRLTPP